MPIKYATNFEQSKCPENYYERLRMPTCQTTSRPFNQPPPPNETFVAKPVSNVSLYKSPDHTIQYPQTTPYTLNSFFETTISNQADRGDDGIYSRGGNILKSTKNIMESYHQQMQKENPKMSPHDRIMAEMAAATYIHNEEQLYRYIQETSHIADAGYKLNVELTRESEGLMLVFEKNGKPTLAFRGTENWIGQDGLSNLTNTTGITRGSQVLARATGVNNPILKDQNKIDKLMEKVYDVYGQIPEDFTGHSLGGARSKLARLWFRNNHKSKFSSLSEHKITAFMPAPGGGSYIHAQDNAYKFYATEFFDPVALIDRLQMTLTNQQGVANIFRSNKGYSILNSHNVENATGGISIKDAMPSIDNMVFSNEELIGSRAIDIQEETPVRPPLEELNLEPPIMTERLHAGTRAVLNETAPALTSFGTSYATSQIANSLNIDPNSQTGILAESTINTTLDSVVAGGARGMMNAGQQFMRGSFALSEAATTALSASASTAATIALPTLAAYEVATSVGQAVHNATSHWEDRGAAGALEGSAAGFSGTLAALGTSTAVGIGSSLFNAARLARLGYSVLPVAEEAIIGAGVGEALVGAEEALALAPVPGARVVALGLGAATLIGAGLGWLFSHHDSPEERAKKAEDNRQHLIEQYHNIQHKFEAAYSNHPFNINSLEDSLLDPSTVLSQDEIDFMNHLSENKFFQSYTTNVTNLWQDQVNTHNTITRLNERRQQNPFLQVSDLSAEERELLSTRYPQVLDEMNDNYTRNSQMIQNEAERLNVPENDLRNLYTNRHSGSINEEQFRTQMDTYEANTVGLTYEQFQTLRNTPEEARDEVYNQMRNDEAQQLYETQARKHIKRIQRQEEREERRRERHQESAEEPQEEVETEPPTE